MENLGEAEADMMDAAPPSTVSLLPEARWIWRAWHRLSVQRVYRVEGVMMPMGGARIVSRPAGIPWDAVDRWCVAHGYGDDERGILDACIVAMEVEFRAHWVREQKAST